MRFLVVLAAVAATSLTLAQDSTTTLDGISFADDPTVYAPIREICDALGLQVGFDGTNATINGVVPDDERSLLSGSRIAPIRSLRALGVTVRWDEETDIATLTSGDKSVEVFRGPKRVVVDQSTQMLEAYQGQRLILRTPISTGRPGHETPNGEFDAGPVKEPMHYSRLYDNSPMPWSVQVDGDVFIHGYSSVPESPASHGCIRMHLDGTNPAKWFYGWVDLGTPITVQGAWEYGNSLRPQKSKST
jgi:lipoprotein-anchoring transpeptidase ErfK/SrfK